MSEQSLMIILTAISSLGALGAAIASWLSARATETATEAQIFSLHFAEYGAPDMLKALRVLRTWESQTGPDFALKWKRAFDAGEKNAHDVDQARRKVTFYFMKPLRLYEARYISLKLLKSLTSVDGINILYDIVEPLESVLNPSKPSSEFKKLRRLCGKSGTLGLMAPVPVDTINPLLYDNLQSLQPSSEAITRTL